MSISTGLQRRKQRRVWRVRNCVKRSAFGRHRLTVFRSNKHLYAQVIDDERGVTVASACTLELATLGVVESGGNSASARIIGVTVAERCLAAGISEVVFDRGGYKYHGRVAALADGARGAGLNF